MSCPSSRRDGVCESYRSELSHGPGRCSDEPFSLDLLWSLSERSLVLWRNSVDWFFSHRYRGNTFLCQVKNKLAHRNSTLEQTSGFVT